MGEEFKDAEVDKPITLNLEATGVSTEALSILFGFDGSKSAEPTHAVTIDTTDTVSGAPEYPKNLPTLDLPWWRILERRRRIAARESLIAFWQDAYADWVAEGRPDREIHIRRYLPNARIEIQEG